MNNYYLFTMISMLLLLLTLTTFYIVRRKNKSMGTMIIMYIGMFISTFFLFIPYNIQFSTTILQSVFVSLNNSLQLLFIDSDFTDIWANLDATYDGPLFFMWDFPCVYKCYTSMLAFIEPLLMLSTILSVIAQFLWEMRYKLRLYRNTYIFSDINDQTVEAAKAIKGRANIVFAGVFIKTGDEDYYLVKKVTKIGALCLKRDITSFKIPKFMSNKIHFYFWGRNENENIKKALEVADNIKNSRVKIRMNIYSSSEEARLIFDSLNRNLAHKRNVSIHLINEYERAVQDMLYKRPLFLGARDKKISVLIVGCGAVGSAAIKNVVMLGQIFDHSLEVHVVDINATAYSEQLRKEAPDLLKRELGYNLNFYDIDVNTGAFSDFINCHPDINYVIVALGNDKLNTQTAVFLRTAFAQSMYNLANPRTDRIHTVPIINVFFYNYIRANRIETLENVEGINYNIYAFGLIDFENCTDNVVDAMYEQLARQIHYLYYTRDTSKKVSNYTKTEYRFNNNRRASYAGALHTIYKLYYCLQDKYPQEAFINNGPTDFYRKNKQMFIDYDNIVNQPFDRDSDCIQVRLANMEHYRWCANMRINGNTCASKEQLEAYYEYMYEVDGNDPSMRDHYNSLAKLHPCLVSWELNGEPIIRDGLTFKDELDYVTYMVHANKCRINNTDFDSMPVKNFKDNDILLVKEIYHIYKEADKRM